ncbi:MAG TPA: c-type cytochrome domain-containing protein [Candidatus Limnocylindria bacterium]|nr:c-type cytochrome domain-containing protein [Candidatus Limnocylindria bacterium]
MNYLRNILCLVGASLLVVSVADAATPVSFYNDLVPVMKRSCTGCHHPGKLKGDFDLTTYAAFAKGGKHGPGFVAGVPTNSIVIDEIVGDEPSMPKEGDPLSKAEVALFTRWIIEGAKDDTPTNANSFKLSEPPTYAKAPVISALAFSPDGKTLAVSGYHEVLLHSADGSNLVARLLGESLRIESLAYSPNGKLLGVSGGVPARFGEIQIWDTATNGLVRSIKSSIDSLYGISFSPDSEKVAVGGADKSVRVFSIKDGKEIMKFDNHSDWTFGTTFTMDGKRLLSGSRDRAMNLIDVSNSQFIDDINKLLENVLCMARHPKEDLIVYGGEQGVSRIYKIVENQGRTAANNDVNLIKAYERLGGPVQAIAWSPNGTNIVVGGADPEVRVYTAGKEGKRVATLKGHEGAIFALTFHPTTNWLATGGFDGQVRLYDYTARSNALLRAFVPVPIKDATVQTAAK